MATAQRRGLSGSGDGANATRKADFALNLRSNQAFSAELLLL